MITLFTSFFALTIGGIPVGFAILGSTLIFMYFFADVPMVSFVQRIIANTQPFPLVAIPLYILAGNLMNASGISMQMMKLANALSGHLTGGLGQVNVVLSALLGGISGTVNGDAAFDSKVLVPMMVKKGYSPGFSAAVTAASAVISPMIPPGVGYILFGFVANVSIGQLFMGSVIPGLLVTFMEMVTVYIIAKKRKYWREPRRATLKEIVLLLPETAPAVLMPILLIMGIRFGIYTPTEGGGLCALYALVVGLLYKRITWRNFYESLRDTVTFTSAIMLLLAVSGAFSYLLTVEQVPVKGSQLLLNLTKQPQIMLLVIWGFLFLVGMFVEGTAGILILGPMLLEVVRNLGVDPVHFGVIMCFAMYIGAITPPVGTAMYTVCSITKVSVPEFTRESLPFFITLVIAGIIVIFIPGLVTWLAYL
jgi:tripartite ATP-independent transporter DctM subunit